MSVRASNRWHIFKRSLAVWLLLMVAEIVHGILRAFLLVPFVGEFRSNQIGVFTGSILIVVIARFTIHWIGAARQSELCRIGLLWVTLTATFEILFGRYVMDLPWERLIADYHLVQGGLMPLGLLVLWFSPMIAAKMQRGG